MQTKLYVQVFLSEFLKYHLFHEIWEKDKSKTKILGNIEPREDRAYFKNHSC